MGLKDLGVNPFRHNGQALGVKPGLDRHLALPKGRNPKVIEPIEQLLKFLMNVGGFPHKQPNLAATGKGRHRQPGHNDQGGGIGRRAETGR